MPGLGYRGVPIFAVQLLDRVAQSDREHAEHLFRDHLLASFLVFLGELAPLLWVGALHQTASTASESS